MKITAEEPDLTTQRKKPQKWRKINENHTQNEPKNYKNGTKLNPKKSIEKSLKKWNKKSVSRFAGIKKEGQKTTPQSGAVRIKNKSKKSIKTYENKPFNVNVKQ